MSKLVGQSMRQVADAASAFESRWTLRALRRVDPGLHRLLAEQRVMWEEALVAGAPGDLAEHTGGMCRGWAAAAARMEEAGAEDDAYVLGTDARSGLRVAISDQQAAQARVREIAGQPVVFVTPDEVATLLAAQQELLRIKGAFPGCEVIDLYPTEPKAA